MKGVMTVDRLNEVVDSINKLVKKDILVGIPAENADRDDEIDFSANNAALGYLHETGSPAANIPARPFLVPGVTESQPRYEPELKKAVNAALDGQPRKVSEHLNKAGLIASQAAKDIINEGDLAPLAISTLKARARRGRKGAAAELQSRAEGNAPDNSNARPLLDTAQMRNAITYVLRG